MPAISPSAPPLPAILVLGIDTCGPSGSVALGRIAGPTIEILDQVDLEGRSYSTTLVAAVAELLARHSIGLRQIGCIVAVSGPGSFTGVRVGLSAVKGLAEGAHIPVIAVSRLEVLARKAGVVSSALDAHRHEVYLRVAGEGKGAKEMLAGSDELHAIIPAPVQIAVSDQAAGTLLASAWPDTELVQVAAPTAADALELAAPAVRAGEFVDLALLDGNYLRRSDAEIFGEPAPASAQLP